MNGKKARAIRKAFKVKHVRLARKRFLDLGEHREDGTLRPAYERWPNGAPT